MVDVAEKYLGPGSSDVRDEALDRERKRRIRALLSAVGAMTGVMAMTGSLWVAMNDRVSFKGLTTSTGESRQRENEVYGSRITEITQQLRVIQKAQESIGRLPSNEQSAVQQRALVGRIDGLEKRLSALEAALMTSPEKALSVPIMRRDLDNMRETNAQSLTSIKASVDQIYDLSKWLLGALAVGVLSLAIANFFTKK